MGGTAAITATAVQLQSDSSQTTTFKALFSTGRGGGRETSDDEEAVHVATTWQTQTEEVKNENQHQRGTTLSHRLALSHEGRRE